LPALLAAAEAASDDAGLGEEGRFAVRLAVEELCSNVIEHGYGTQAPGELTLRLAVGPDGLAVTVADRAPLFDPSQAPAPDLSSDWLERRVGGLGVHLVRHVMDELRHEPRPGGGNLVTVVKRRRAG
jgi:anti-sigma regulatory factor (Ser/Thr protein kinase)